MESKELNDHIRRSLTILIESADELRDLDQALGDGDLGITISAGSKAVIEALEELPDDTAPTEIARTCAKAFANANPSTMAALVAGALLSGSRTWEGESTIGVAEAARFTRAAADSIAQRGKTQVGDKTILDGISAASDALESVTDPGEALEATKSAAEKAVQETTSLQSRRGRASWLQERSIGLADPGATAFQRFVEAWAAAGVAKN
jgi:dihydroxyacetone kinase-like protein